MEEINSKISPNEEETEILLKLCEWCNSLKELNNYHQYVLDNIECDIHSSWENPNKRKETIGKAPYQLDAIKKSLIQKYKENGEISQQLINKVESLKISIDSNIYEHYLWEARFYYSFGLHLARKKIFTIAMMESDCLPKWKVLLDFDIQKEVNEFGDKILSVNNNYIQLVNWSQKLYTSDTITDVQKEHLKKYSITSVIGILENSLKDKEPLAKAQNHIMEFISEKHIKSFSSVLLNVESSIIGEREKTKLYPNQERFYSTLEEWASEIKNPCCRKWIIEYLEKGRHLPFYQLKVFKFQGNIDMAKTFLLDKYEQTILRKYVKNKGYEEKCLRRQDKNYKRLVKGLRKK